jgi:hypothetical protein
MVYLNVDKKSFGVKYTHVDYESVGIGPWEKDVETGDRAHHIHFSQKETEELFVIPVTVLGVVLGYVTADAADLVALLVTGGLLTAGAVSSIEIRDLIVDETNSFWTVTGKEKLRSKELPGAAAQYAAIIIPVINLLATVPDYYRVGSLMLWDLAGLGDPDEYA